MPKRATGVHPRDRTNIYWWRIRVPKDLKHLYPGKVYAHRCSLGTPVLADANRKGAKLYAEWLETFDKQRKGSTRVEALTPEHGKAIGHEALKVLLADEKTRLDPLDRKLMLRPLQAMGVAGMAGFAQELGITFDAETPGAQEAFAHYMATVEGPMRAKLAEVPAAAPARPKKATSLRDVWVRWVASDPTRTEDSNRACERALELFEQQHREAAKDVTTITRSMGDEFKAWLQQPERGTASKTARDRFNWIKSLLKYAWQELELIPKQPWQGQEVKSRTETKRGTWSTEDVRKFFGRLALFTDYELPRNRWKAGGAAAYWVPLLGLFTGARLGELCQLRVADVVQVDGCWCISINEDGEGSRVKSEAGIRSVPLHSELIRLGLLDYVEATRKAGHERLWPDLKFRKDKPSGYFSAWFGEVRTAEDVPDFHSLRHTVRSQLARAKVPATTQDRITGHETQGSTGSRVYTHVSMPELVEAVEAVRYEGLELPRVYRKD